jgi:hypothetical protein
MKKQVVQCVGRVVEVGKLLFSGNYIGGFVYARLYFVVHILLPIAKVRHFVFPIQGVLSGAKLIVRAEVAVALCP